MKGPSVAHWGKTSEKFNNTVFIFNINVWCSALNYQCDLVAFHSLACLSVFSQVWCGLHLCTVRDRCLDPWERSFFGITETASDSRGHHGPPPRRPSPAGVLGWHGWTQQRTMQSVAILSYRTENTVLSFSRKIRGTTNNREASQWSPRYEQLQW